MQPIKPYQPQHKIRIVTAASLFDGHDAAINIMRRIMQSSGAEIIHLGHNRSVQEIVNCAIQEDVQGIAITSYQGGHIEFFKYMYDLLHEQGAGHIKIFGGGGGTILPEEITELMAYGITKIYSPDDGRSMGLQGMINHVLSQCDTDPTLPPQRGGEKDLPQPLQRRGETSVQPKSASSPLGRSGGVKFGYVTTDPILYPLLKEFADKHKNNPTRAESFLWNNLKGKQVGEHKFRRQHIIDQYIADFVCLEKMLIIEVDGAIHQLPQNQISDAERTERLNQYGYQVIRFTNEEILFDIDNSLNKIKASLDNLKSYKDENESKNLVFDKNRLLTKEALYIGRLISIAENNQAYYQTNIKPYLQEKQEKQEKPSDSHTIPTTENLLETSSSHEIPSPWGRKGGVLDTTSSHEIPSPWGRKGGVLDTTSSHEVPSPWGRKGGVLGITGTGGAGKSSLVDELVRRFLLDFPTKNIAIVSVDPSKRKTGGALLGDRIRMNAINNGRVYMRSLATRQSNLALSKHIQDAVDILKAAAFDLIILETSGIGQSDTEITDHSDVSLYVMTPEFGAATQLEKIDMLDFADVIAINKFDKRGALDALRDVRKQYQRNHNLWDADTDTMPVFGTMASQFNDPGMNNLYRKIMDVVVERTGADLKTSYGITSAISEKIYIIPPNRTRYLSEIAENNRNYDVWVNKQVEIARNIFSVKNTIKLLTSLNPSKGGTSQQNGILSSSPPLEGLGEVLSDLELDLDGQCKRILENWEAKKANYAADEFVYQVRGKDIRVPTFTKSLSHNKIPRVVLPKFKDWGEILRWCLQENVPGEFPYTSGVFPFKREGEDPTRMFAGEGNPERTNRRFHYVSLDMPATRLSTAFDSVTLYGEDPDYRPDIYGKIGNSGVSICCLDDAKKLYSGFDLCNPKTSVSMTINGPAATIAAYFMNAAIDQQCEMYIKENGLKHLVEAKLHEKYESKGFARPRYVSPPSEGSGEVLPKGNNGLGLMLLGITGDEILELSIYNQLKAKALSSVRGTVQADILKEDQAQNTCIFSTEFSLRLMGDVQQYFIDHKIRNFYSVSISGYHIAEAGANPISQLAFTLSNGFTFVEYYVSRGMNIDDFAPNLSFFFSNGIDPEYAVIGRVARRIWAKAMKQKYNANERSQQLKYHIQTSGRSLHAQEIDFNDIRTTLQALYAIYDNCNSLHTNAYDEAITTPTEESVRRAMAIQLIINRELGLAKNENPLQGSFIIEELTDLVEEAVLVEFDRINERGGVLGAMETMYQRGKIQEESLHYEMLKHTGEYPIIGVNTFLAKNGSPTVTPGEIIRATEEEKEAQIVTLNNLKAVNADKSPSQLADLQHIAVENGNLFDALMEAGKTCSLGQITNALYEVGGQYRRNM